MDKYSLIVRPAGALRGALGQDGVPQLPGDKSLSHRAALFAALAQGESHIENFLISGVTDAMLEALTALGVRWSLEDTSLRVEGLGFHDQRFSGSNEAVRIDCGNSGTTMRLLAGALAAWNRHAVLDGSAGLQRRPMRRISDPLRLMGLEIADIDGHAPITIRPGARPLLALDYSLPVASAQVKSCLMLAALVADRQSVLREPGPSRDHSERMLRAMGVEVTSEQADAVPVGDPAGVARQYLTRVNPPVGGALAPLRMTLPGDISAAAFIIVAALITPGSHVVLRGVGLNPTRTGLLEALARMGANVDISNRREQGGEPLGDLNVRYSDLNGVEIDGELVVRMIDEFPVFAVAAACASGQTTVSQAAELRHKESDRISALCGELAKLGVQVREKPDGFIIQGGRKLNGGHVLPHGDHRLAMSLAVAGLSAGSELHINGGRIIDESFPDFVTIMTALGAELYWEAGG